MIGVLIEYSRAPNEDYLRAWITGAPFPTERPPMQRVIVQDFREAERIIYALMNRAVKTGRPFGGATTIAIGTL